VTKDYSVITPPKVRYAETDQMASCTTPINLSGLNSGVELLASLGLAYSQMEKDHKADLRW